MTLGYFQAGIRPDFKADDTPVTVADRETGTIWLPFCKNIGAIAETEICRGNGPM